MTWIPLDTNARREGRLIGNPATWKARPAKQTNRCNRNYATCSQWYNAWTCNYTRCKCNDPDPSSSNILKNRGDD